METEKASMLLDMLGSGASDCEDRVEKIVEWKNTRFMERGKLIVSGALSLLASLLVAFLKNEFKDHVGWAIFCMGSALLAAYVGFRHLNRSRHAGVEYVNALVLLDSIRNRPDLIARLQFLVRYIPLP